LTPYRKLANDGVAPKGQTRARTGPQSRCRHFRQNWHPDTRLSCRVGSLGGAWHYRRGSDCACRRCRIELRTPLTKAIVAAAENRGLTRLAVTNFEALSGRGAKALVEGTSIEIGRSRLVTEARVTVPPEIEKTDNRMDVGWEGGSFCARSKPTTRSFRGGRRDSS